MKIKRYLVLVGVLVGMGLGTVWWKSRTVAMGYEAVRLSKEISSADEERMLEDSRIATMTAPGRVKSEANRLGLAKALRNRKVTKPGSRRGEGDGRSARVANR